MLRTGGGGGGGKEPTYAELTAPMKMLVSTIVPMTAMRKSAH